MNTAAIAGGISVDAGLTPAEDRWIFRTQLRHMERSNDPGPMNRQMEVNVWNNVLAYGLRRNLTLMVRQPYMRRKMTMGGSSVSKSGLGDFMVMGKYGLYRKNTADYILGVAATMALEMPTGSDAFTSDTWDLKPGLFLSWRNGVDPGDELELDFALARQFSIGESADAAFSPVLEISYRDVSANQLAGQSLPHSGESVLFLSPGAKLTLSSFILEVLVQIPVSQSQKGIQTERDTGFILGVRYMF
jgi:hypothetical protein